MTVPVPNQLVYVSDALFTRAIDFCRRHPQIVSMAQMIQKLVILDFVIPVLLSRAHARILEIGSGLGIHSALLSHVGRVSSTELRVPGSFVGADHDVQKARAVVFEELGSGTIEFAYHDGERMPFPDGTFDIVFHNSVIEHVPDIEAFNAEVLRVLKPGGTCICITGTPALCRFRLAKHYAKLPMRFAIALAKELVPQRWLPSLARLAARIMGRGSAMADKIAARLARVDRRLASVAPEASAGGEPRIPVAMRKMYARLFHYIYFPLYNRTVIEESAATYGIAPDDLLRGAWQHFQRARHRLAFELNPVTHGQHYEDVWHEMSEWRVERWRELFRSSGFDIESVHGYRYHQRLEITPSARLNSLLYLRATKRIQRRIAAGRADPEKASEFVLVARKALA